VTYRELLPIINNLEEYQLDHEILILDSMQLEYFYVNEAAYVLVEDDDVELGQLYLEV